MRSRAWYLCTQPDISTDPRYVGSTILDDADVGAGEGVGDVKLLRSLRETEACDEGWSSILVACRQSDWRSVRARKMGWERWEELVEAFWKFGW